MYKSNEIVRVNIRLKGGCTLIIHSTLTEHQLCFCARFMGGCRKQGPLPALGLAASTRVCIQAKESLGALGFLALSAPTSCPHHGAAMWSAWGWGLAGITWEARDTSKPILDTLRPQPRPVFASGAQAQASLGCH